MTAGGENCVAWAGLPPRRPAALQVRHQAALALVEAGELDGALALSLSLVVWPPKGSRLEDEHVPLGREYYPEDVKAEVRRRHAAGETLLAIAASTGIPFGTCDAWCSASAQRCEASCDLGTNPRRTRRYC
jgi:hypothetical protein